MIDLNGDCFSDLLILSGTNNHIAEIYIKNNHNNYDYSTTTLGKNITWLSFTDFDGNGATDMLLVAS